MTAGVVARVQRRRVVQSTLCYLLAVREARNLILPLVQVERFMNILEAEAEVVSRLAGLSRRTS